MTSVCPDLRTPVEIDTDKVAEIFIVSLQHHDASLVVISDTDITDTDTYGSRQTPHPSSVRMGICGSSPPPVIPDVPQCPVAHLDTCCGSESLKVIRGRAQEPPTRAQLQRPVVQVHQRRQQDLQTVWSLPARSLPPCSLCRFVQHADASPPRPRQLPPQRQVPRRRDPGRAPPAHLPAAALEHPHEHHSGPALLGRRQGRGRG